MISDTTKQFLPPKTPDWILKIIDEGPHGGWFTPTEMYWREALKMHPSWLR